MEVAISSDPNLIVRITTLKFIYLHSLEQLAQQLMYSTFSQIPSVTSHFLLITMNSHEE